MAIRIPDGYELLTPQNARVGLEFITQNGRHYTIRSINGDNATIEENRSTRVSLLVDNKFIRSGSADVPVPTPDLESFKYHYCLHPSITSRPAGFNKNGEMDYMLDPTWVYSTNEPLDLLGRCSIPRQHGGGSWTLIEGEIIHLDDRQAIIDEITNKAKWSNSRSMSVNFINDYLYDQIRVRYAMTPIPRDATRNKVIDSYMPKMLLDVNLRTDRLSNMRGLNSTARAISPWYAAMLNIPAIPASELCRVLGYSTKSLKKLITTIRQKDITIGFIGYGGTNINTIYWLAEILKFTGTARLFKRVVVYEREDIEVSNLLRFPKNPVLASSQWGTNKLSLLSDELPLLSNDRTVSLRYFSNSDDILLSNEAFKYSNTVLYGAPGINTRVELSKLGNFISATHGSTECSIHLNPAQDTELQVESYGVIQLNSFFMNQIRLAIGLLETLASEQDLAEQNKEILTYSFDGTTKLKTINTYNFGVNTSGTLTAEN